MCSHTVLLAYWEPSDDEEAILEPEVLLGDCQAVMSVMDALPDGTVVEGLSIVRDTLEAKYFKGLHFSD